MKTINLSCSEIRYPAACRGEFHYDLVFTTADFNHFYIEHMLGTHQTEKQLRYALRASLRDTL